MSPNEWMTPASTIQQKLRVSKKCNLSVSDQNDRLRMLPFPVKLAPILQREVEGQMHDKNAYYDVYSH